MKATRFLPLALGIPAALAMPLLSATGNGNQMSGSAGTTASPAKAAKAADITQMGAQFTMGRGTYPRITHLGDGSLLGTFTTFANGNTTMKALRSTDGRAWKELGSIAGAPTAQRDIDNPFALQLPSGRILAAYRNHDRVPGTSTEWAYFRIQLSYSDDQGSTWHYLSTLIEHPGPTVGDFEPFMRMADDGQTLQMYWSHQNANADQDSYLALSTDGGRTFTQPAVISGRETNNTRDGMLGVAKVGAKLVAVFECKENGAFDIRSVESSDDGATWGNRKLVYTAGLANPECTQSGGGTVCNAGAPQITTVRDKLVVSFMTDEDTPKGAWVAGARAKFIISTDGGESWSGSATWTSQQSYWPSVITLDNVGFMGAVEVGGTTVLQEFAVGGGFKWA